MNTSGRHRWVVVIALAAYSTALAVVLLAPTSGRQSEAASWLGEVGTWVGVPERFLTQSRVEFVCNALILMPVSALGSLVWPRAGWRAWTAYAFIISCTVELTQGLLLPDRTVATADVVANTLGGLGGALVVGIGSRLVRPAS